jgi:hypothetical protein
VQPMSSNWDYFTNYLLRKPLFWAPSNHRIHLCILMDFIKWEKLFFTTIDDPIHNMIIITSTVNYRNGTGCEYPFQFYSNLVLPQLDFLPMPFVLQYNREVRGIVYSESQYYLHQENKYYPHDLFHNFFDDYYNGSYREEFYVCKVLDRSWIIILLFQYKENDIIKNRCRLQNLGTRDTRDVFTIADKNVNKQWYKRFYSRRESS